MRTPADEGHRGARAHGQRAQQRVGNARFIQTPGQFAKGLVNGAPFHEKFVGFAQHAVQAAHFLFVGRNHTPL